MAKRPPPTVSRPSVADQDVRDQEVLRANRELAAYFQGRRTEREARAALKIIKEFVRDRERRDAKNRAPLPGVKSPQTSTTTSKRKAPRRKPRVQTISAEIVEAAGKPTDS